MGLYFHLIVQFFQIGLFSFGGGYATLPFLYRIGEDFGWYSSKQLTEMLAVSSITPGPVGINVATFAGFTTSGILGALIATVSIVFPSFIIATIVYKLLDKFKTSKYVKGAIKAIKPAGCALLSAVGLKLLLTSNLHLLGGIFLGILFISTFFKKYDAIFYLGVSAFFGVLIGAFNLIGV